MIEYFNIPSGALINTPISKKLFAEKAPLSSGEKRLLREEIEKLTMKGLLQTRTIGLAAYMDDEQAYDQIIIAEVSIKNPAKAMPVATMVQKAFPAPMFLVIHCDESFSVNWCVKRINQADRTRRVMEEQQITRFFVPEGDDSIICAWLPSLDIARIRCNSLKELFDQLSAKLLLLKVADETYTKLDYVKEMNTNKVPSRGGFTIKDGSILDKNGVIVDGLTESLGKGNSAVYLSKSAFVSMDRLKMTIGHEYIHATHNFMASKGILDANAKHNGMLWTEISAHHWENHMWGVQNGYGIYERLLGKFHWWRKDYFGWLLNAKY